MGGWSIWCCRTHYTLVPCSVTDSISVKRPSIQIGNFPSRILFIFRHPKSIPSNTFTLPFRSALWYAIMGLVFCSTCIIWNIFSVENHKKVRNSINIEQANEDSFSNSILMMLGFIFQQGDIIILDSLKRPALNSFTAEGYSGNIVLTSSRILVAAVLLFALLVYQFYSSFIVGSLLIEAPKNIKTMKQLLNSPLSFGQDEQPYVINNFQYAQEESTVKLYKKIMKHPEHTVMSANTGLELLKNGKPTIVLNSKIYQHFCILQVDLPLTLTVS